MAETQGNPYAAPRYARHRSGVTAADAAIIEDRTVGCNTEGYTHAHIQVIPTGGGNPTVEVLWWSEAAGRFIEDHVLVSKAGKGANVPFEFTVDCQNRIMFVRFDVLAAGTCEVMVSGFHSSAL